MTLHQPWVEVSAPDPDAEYVATISFLPLRGLRGLLAVPSFMIANQRAAAQARGAPGIVGYSQRVEFLRRHFWTLSVWRDDLAIGAYSKTAPHHDLMKRFRPLMGGTKAVRFRVRGSALPPKWDDAIRRWHERGR